MNITWEQVKEFLARLFSRGRQGVETLSDSLDRQAKIQRLAAQVRGLARERNTLIVTIGKKVYALHGRGKVKNRDVLGDCLRLDQIREEIAELKHKIEEIRLSLEERPEVDLEDDSLLAEEEPAATADEPQPEEAEGPAPEVILAVDLAPEVDEAEDDTEDGSPEPARV